jgi:hypothetical protein
MLASAMIPRRRITLVRLPAEVPEPDPPVVPAEAARSYREPGTDAGQGVLGGCPAAILRTFSTRVGSDHQQEASDRA